MAKNTSFQLCIAASTFLTLTACGMGDSGPTDKQVEDKIMNWIDTTYLGDYGGNVKDRLKLESIHKIDKSVQDNKAKVIVTAEFSCLQSWDGYFSNGRYEEYFGKGNGSCKQGQKKIAEMQFLLEKYDSGWR